MQYLEGRFIYSASDLTSFSECAYLSVLDREVALGERTRPEPDDAVALIARKGEEHELRYLERLREEHGDGVVVFANRASNSLAGLREADAQTLQAIERGAPLIYQATFFDGTFLGRADFLRRVETPSARFPWSYEVVDTKLALATKPYFLIQLCHYSEHLERLQGTAPLYCSVVLGSGVEKRYRVDDYAAYYRRLKQRFLNDRTADVGAVYPWKNSHCGVCPWDPECQQRRDDDDHLSVVASMRRDQVKKLNEGGIATLAALAAATDASRPFGMSESTFANLRAQAAQQHEQRRAIAEQRLPKHFYAFRPLEERSGFAKLPQPAPGDMFFDMEGDPLFRADRGLEYLFGCYLPDENEYKAFGGKTPAEERDAFERFVDFAAERLRRYLDAHVYHYASYEMTALKRLAGRFASREREIDDFLRGEKFVDLFPVVRQGLWISQPSYSIKKVESFYHWERKTATQSGDDSILMFESWLASGDDTFLEDIRAYNEDDCRSTHALRSWLVGLRDELNAGLPEPIAWRPRPAPPERKDDTTRSDLEKQLLNGLPAPVSLDELRRSDDTVRARWLLGNLLQYFRRENKPEWWTYFERCANPQDLAEFDREALGNLKLRTEVAPYKLAERDRNLVYTYGYPAQDHHLGSKPACPYARKGAGALVSIDDATQTLRIKLAGAIRPDQLRALIPGQPLSIDKKRDAMERFARSYVDGALNHTSSVTLELLLAQPPRVRGIAPGTSIQPAVVTNEAVSRTIAALDRSYLFVQGPPGSGKTSTGARAIVDLLAANKRVGVVANSHKAVHELVRKVEEMAYERRLRFSGCHKESGQTEGSRYESYAPWPMVRSADDASAFGACDLASGTTFAWAEQDNAGRFDYIFIDEAGQVSLADALIASLTATNVVLLGDPLQLPQVTKGSHPIGTDLSVLEHLLGGAHTVPPTHGIFLTTSYRMHPRIAAFISEAIYEGRLRADALNARNAILLGDDRRAGVFYVSVKHEGNGRYSLEEAQQVVQAVRALLGGSVAKRDEPVRPMTQNDILVVSPYNLQRAKISAQLRDAGYGDVRVGTVDKFQGQEAAVVLYSMATSSKSDMPRDLSFLFQPNRFNVAISRAKCLTVLFFSPELLSARGNTPEEIAMVNLLCLYVEEASDFHAQGYADFTRHAPLQGAPAGQTASAWE